MSHNFCEGWSYTLSAIMPAFTRSHDIGRLGISHDGSHIKPSCSHNTAFAPLAMAWGMNWRPSPFSPTQATNVSPGFSRRLSVTRLVILTPKPSSARKSKYDFD